MTALDDAAAAIQAKLAKESDEDVLDEINRLERQWLVENPGRNTEYLVDILERHEELERIRMRLCPSSHPASQ